MEGGVPLNELIEMEKETIQNMIPSLYLILTFPKQNFETILESRRISGSKDHSRHRTVWHAADAEKQLKRHAYYLELDQIYKSSGNPRNIRYLDGSQKPTITVFKALKEASQSLSEKELQGRLEIEFRRSLLTSYMGLVNNGAIDHIMHNWKFQQHLLEEKSEGKIVQEGT